MDFEEKMLQTNIFVWPDGVWVYEDEYEEIEWHKSDDFQIVTIDAELTPEEIEEFVLTLI